MRTKNLADTDAENYELKPKKKKSLVVWTTPNWIEQLCHNFYDNEKGTSPYLPSLRNYKKYICDAKAKKVRITIEEI